jgi:hypothetical protein
MSNWNRARYALVLMVVVSAAVLLLLSLIAIDHVRIMFDWRVVTPLYVVCWLVAPWLSESIPVNRTMRKNLAKNDKQKD